MVSRYMRLPRLGSASCTGVKIAPGASEQLHVLLGCATDLVLSSSLHPACQSISGNLFALLLKNGGNCLSCASCGGEMKLPPWCMVVPCIGRGAVLPSSAQFAPVWSCLHLKRRVDLQKSGASSYFHTSDLCHVGN